MITGSAVLNVGKFRNYNGVKLYFIFTMFLTGLGLSTVCLRLLKIAGKINNGVNHV